VLVNYFGNSTPLRLWRRGVEREEGVFRMNEV
jgi:hypothetical protein